MSAPPAPLNILSVATTYPRFAGDTERSFVHDLNRHLAGRGHHLTALVPHAPGAALQENLDGIDVRRFRYAPDAFEKIFYGGGALPNLRASWRAKLALPGALYALRRAIAQTTARLKPDILHVHWLLPQGYFALGTAAKYRVPLVVTVHGADIHQVAQGRLKNFARTVVRSAAALTANTNDTARTIERVAPPRLLKVLPMGIELGLFDPSRKDPEAKRGLGIRGPWLLAVGRLVEKKGFVHLVEALPAILQKFPDAALTFGGEGPERPKLEQRAQALSVTQAVQFLGPLDRPTVARYMASADVFVGPSVVDSKGDTEAQGVVFVEALASGCPVVATTVGGIPDVIQDGVQGRLVKPQDCTALAAAVIDALSNQAVTQRQVAAGLQHAQQYSWEGIAAGFELLFRELVTSCGTGNSC